MKTNSHFRIHNQHTLFQLKMDLRPNPSIVFTPPSVDVDPANVIHIYIDRSCFSGNGAALTLKNVERNEITIQNIGFRCTPLHLVRILATFYELAKDPRLGHEEPEKPNRGDYDKKEYPAKLKQYEKDLIAYNEKDKFLIGGSEVSDAVLIYIETITRNHGCPEAIYEKETNPLGYIFHFYPLHQDFSFERAFQRWCKKCDKNPPSRREMKARDPDDIEPYRNNDDFMAYGVTEYSELSLIEEDLEFTRYNHGEKDTKFSMSNVFSLERALYWVEQHHGIRISEDWYRNPRISNDDIIPTDVPSEVLAAKAAAAAAAAVAMDVEQQQPRPPPNKPKKKKKNIDNEDDLFGGDDDDDDMEVDEFGNVLHDDEAKEDDNEEGDGFSDDASSSSSRGGGGVKLYGEDDGPYEHVDDPNDLLAMFGVNKTPTDKIEGLNYGPGARMGSDLFFPLGAYKVGTYQKKRLFNLSLFRLMVRFIPNPAKGSREASRLNMRERDMLESGKGQINEFDMMQARMSELFMHFDDPDETIREQKRTEAWEYLCSREFHEDSMHLLAHDTFCPGSMAVAEWMVENQDPITKENYFIQPITRMADKQLTYFGNHAAMQLYLLEKVMGVNHLHPEAFMNLLVTIGSTDLGMSNSMKMNVLQSGLQGSGKSHITELAQEACIPQKLVDSTYESQLAATADVNFNGKVVTMDEVGERLNGSSKGDETGNSISKSMLSKKKLQTTHVVINKETGNRDLHKTTSYHGNVFIGNQNLGFSQMPPAMRDRFLQVAVTLILRAEQEHNSVKNLRNGKNQVHSKNQQEFYQQWRICHAVMGCLHLLYRLHPRFLLNDIIIQGYLGAIIDVIREAGYEVTNRNMSRFVFMVSRVAEWDAYNRVFRSERHFKKDEPFCMKQVLMMLPYLSVKPEHLFFTLGLTFEYLFVDQHADLIMESIYSLIMEQKNLQYTPDLIDPGKFDYNYYLVNLTQTGAFTDRTNMIRGCAQRIAGNMRTTQESISIQNIVDYLSNLRESSMIVESQYLPTHDDKKIAEVPLDGPRSYKKMEEHQVGKVVGVKFLKSFIDLVIDTETGRVRADARNGALLRKCFDAISGVVHSKDKVHEHLDGFSNDFLFWTNKKNNQAPVVATSLMSRTVDMVDVLANEMEDLDVGGDEDEDEIEWNNPCLQVDPSFKRPKLEPNDDEKTDSFVNTEFRRFKKESFLGETVRVPGRKFLTGESLRRYGKPYLFDTFEPNIRISDEQDPVLYSYWRGVCDPETEFIMGRLDTPVDVEKLINRAIRESNPERKSLDHMAWEQHKQDLAVDKIPNVVSRRVDKKWKYINRVSGGYSKNSTTEKQKDYPKRWANICLVTEKKTREQYELIKPNPGSASTFNPPGGPQQQQHQHHTGEQYQKPIQGTNHAVEDEYPAEDEFD
jgi:hypothetical protein